MSQTKISTARQVLKLKSREFISPNYIRITLTGAVADFEHTTVGDNNKIYIPPTGVNEVHFPVLDAETKKWVHEDKDKAPSVRTYTHNGINLKDNELFIDFVNHGECGPASSWALNAKPGDKLGVAMRKGAKELYPKEAAWFLMAGDATSIPVFRAMLKSFPKSAAGVCIITVPTKSDIQELDSKAAIEFQWIVNSDTKDQSKLVDSVKAVQVPSIAKFGYVACEFSAVKQIRSYLRKELQWSSNELYAYSYWKNGVAEDRSVADRQAEKKAIT